MEKVCGYIDINGVFHKTKEETEKTNIKIKIAQIEHLLENFHSILGQEILNSFPYSSDELYRAVTYKDEVVNVILKTILTNSDTFISIILQKKELEEGLDFLRSQDEKVSKKWNKLKWW